MKRPFLKAAGALTAVLISCSFMQAAVAVPSTLADSTAPPAVATMSTVTPERDVTSVLRNPGMGWMAYAEEFDHALADANAFWGEVGPNSAASSVVYLRIPWSRLEPAEGKYAWDVDENFKSFIKQAKDHGQRLAFRVFVDSQDTHQQATPQFVFDAGATGYGAPSNSSFKTPHVNNAIFRAKFENFMAAFGARFDNPEEVDFVDTNTIGHWGEMHNYQAGPTAGAEPVLQWLGNLYRKSFSHVLLALNFAPAFSYTELDQQIAKGSIMRRDSLGSTLWFPQDQKNAISSRFPNTILVGENCYQNFTIRETSCDDSFKVPGAKPYRPMLERVVADAKQLHANYLDLRHEPDVKTWVVDNPDLVQDFAINGGYRLAPGTVNMPSVLPFGARQATVSSSWTNTAWGRMPNDNPQWNNKYQVSYALLNKVTGEPVYQIQSDVNPGSWIKGTSYPTSTVFAPTDVPAGSYDFAIAIVDKTRNNAPGIKLALTGAPSTTGWNKLGTTVLEAAPDTTPTETASPSATATPSASASATATATATATGSVTASVSPTASQSPSQEPATPGIDLSADSVAAGGGLVITGENFLPGSSATFTLHSEPLILGTATADAQGVVRLSVQLPANVPVGSHRIIIDGKGFDGELQQVSAPLIITAATVTTPATDVTTAASTTAPATGGDDLASTGAKNVGIGGLAALLLAAGATLFMLNRRRSSSH
ncbi:hypothetical protein ABIB48_001966 [Arthrobacter sp. UYCu511]|uniref:DUF4832 domain-containing protein n=1 Tax=Arthrobacter sp. UYCu511 TaxID=3156337 RepID=UPI00339821FE